MKGLLLSLLLFICCVPVCLAQRAPLNLRQYQSQGQRPTTIPRAFHPNAAPPYCKPCLAYAGDLDPNDPNADAVSDENDLFVQGSEVWTPVVVKANMTATVTGIFGNFLTTLDGTVDPVVTPWAIRAHVQAGDGGTLGPHGTANVTVTPTGRNLFGLGEYAILAKLDKAVKLQGYRTGATYYFLIQPQCTNPNNSTCASGQRYFLSDTEGSRPNHGGLPTPNDHSFFNSSYFGYVFIPAQQVCGSGCDNFSWGLLGTVQ